MSQLFKKQTGLTMIEVMIAVLLMSVIFLGVSSIYVASWKFYIASSNKAIIGSEVQYAIQHIYKNVMQAIGDETSPLTTSAIDVPSAERVDFRINNNDPITRSNYSTVTTYSYYKSGNTFVFYNGVTEDSLIPKVTVTAVNFTKSTNALTGYITASYNDQSLTFYFSCYPRLASFN
ncbi:MAG: hypothetical protein AUJ70_04690 [Candidatus Omnitrophica bacterium CG1_02_40_15]|nr:MAG: hypothetical protein AUJ70_04690 [Candidatus Omnitrophica bacterium CG1_02_40_15]